MTLPRVLRFSGLSYQIVDSVEFISLFALVFLSFFSIFFILADIINGLCNLLAWAKRFTTKKHEPINQGRRRAILSLGGIAALVYSGISLHKARHPEINRVVIRCPGLHPDLHGFTIAQFSDLHVGPTIKADYVRSVVETINELNVHMIAMTGDLVDGFVPELWDDVAPLRNLKADYGVFYVAGNHEYYWDGPGWIGHAQKELGWTYLGNTHRIVTHGAAQIAVAGTIDIGAKRFFSEELSNPRQAIAGAPPNAFRLLLAHQPIVAFDATKEGYHLQISGHTHGGQFWPWTWVIHAIQPFVKGLYQVEKMLLYVNRGTGYWGPPARLGSPGEITLFVLENEIIHDSLALNEK